MTCGWACLTAATMLVTGCSAEPPDAAAPQRPAAKVSAAPLPASALPTPVVRTTASAAMPAPVIPAELASAPKLVYRALDTGVLVAKSTLVTRTLQRFENQALLTEETQISKSTTFAPVVGPLEAPAIRRYLGTATTTGTVTTFALADGDAKLVFACATGEVRVASATAVRKPGRRSECGDRGVWTPAPTQRVVALRCGIDESPVDPSFPPDRREEMAFVAAPGIEFLFVNDDCVMQGGGYRFIAANGEVAAIRPPGAL